MVEPLLSVSDLCAGYGKTQVVNRVFLSVRRGSIVGLLGPNGVGKTTLLSAIAGLIRPWSGEVRVGGEETSHLAAHGIFERGVALVPQNRELFMGLSVRENLELGAFRRRDRDQVEADLTKLIVRFPRLGERLERPAGELSGGEQQMLAISRAVMSRPKLLLLDEPSLALAPLVVQDIYRLIQEVNATGVSVVLVEQSAQMALSVADYVYCMNAGRIVTHGARQQFFEGDTILQQAFGSVASTRSMEREYVG